jgi:hypothetical protein
MTINYSHRAINSYAQEPPKQPTVTVTQLLVRHATFNNRAIVVMHCHLHQGQDRRHASGHSPAALGDHGTLLINSPVLIHVGHRAF